MSEHAGSAQSDAPQTAMLLTQREWDDLEKVCRHYLDATAWFERADFDEGSDVGMGRAVCTRIIEANR